MTDPAIDPAEVLRQIGQSEDESLDVARAALMLSALDHSGRELAPYEDHLSEIAEAARREARLATHAEDGARALSALMVGRFGYDGDRLYYDDPKNADLMTVIDRRVPRTGSVEVAWTIDAPKALALIGDAITQELASA